jgi:hypothetical protein
MRRAVSVALLLPLLLVSIAAGPAAAQPAARVSVQPFDCGSTVSGSALRAQVARILRGRGYRVLTSIARVGGTGQYPELARDHRLAAFVTGDVEEHPRRHTITFLVWDGATGSVRARWSATAAPKQLGRAVAKGFWKHLGAALDGAQSPAVEQPLAPAAPMYIDAGQPL